MLCVDGSECELCMSTDISRWSVYYQYQVCDVYVNASAQEIQVECVLMDVSCVCLCIWAGLHILVVLMVLRWYWNRGCTSHLLWSSGDQAAIPVSFYDFFFLLTYQYLINKQGSHK